MNEILHPLHQTALRLAKTFLTTEAELVAVLPVIEKEKVYELMGYTSLFEYVVNALSLSRDQAYTLISVARKCKELPPLQKAIEEGTVSVNKARRIVPVLTQENSAGWIEKATKLPQRELERVISIENPDLPKRETLRLISENQASMKLIISVALQKKLERAKQLVSQSTKQPVTLEQTLEAMLDLYLQKKDPIEKAKRRALGTCLKEVSPEKPMPRTLRNQVLLRDQGQCRYYTPQGVRCSNKTWVEVHHKVPLNQGGKHEINNLITLCTAHHHRLHDFEGRMWKRR